MKQLFECWEKKKSKISESCMKKVIRTSKETLKMRQKTSFCNRKIETSPLMLERKSKISAKLYEKDVKTSKETLKTTFAMEKTKQLL